MRGRSILLVESDRACATALVAILRRQGDSVKVARTRQAALSAARRQCFDLAVVDLFLRGGGAELARELKRHVPNLWLTLGSRLSTEEILEAVLGFPVHLKGALPAALAARSGS